MKKIEKISENSNHTAINIGKLSKLPEHSYMHPVSGREIEGKVFIKEVTGSTGTEISFQSLPPDTELGFFHTHRKNEETYVILSGEGDFQVDSELFPVSEGSIIRIAPKGARSLRNNSDLPMVYMVIQSREGSLQEYSSADGERIAKEPLWK